MFYYVLLLKNQPIKIPIIDKEYHLISNENIWNATGSKLLMNIFYNKYNKLNKNILKIEICYYKLAKIFEQGLISSKDFANELMSILKSKRMK